LTDSSGMDGGGVCLNLSVAQNDIG
jgi:hypothetical protein